MLTLLEEHGGLICIQAWIPVRTTVPRDCWFHVCRSEAPVKDQHTMFSFSCMSPLKKLWGINSVQTSGLWDGADKITQHHFSEVTRKEGQDEKEERSTLQGTIEESKGQREREKHWMKEKNVLRIICSST